VVALFDPATGHLRVANGGHPAPMVIVPDGDAIEATLIRTAGPVLGVVRDAEFPARDLLLPAGAAFCAYTDGLTDRHHDPASIDGRRLLRVAAEAYGRLDGEPAAQRLAENIVRDLLGGAAPDDDVCLAVLFAGAA
jgi:serine phosphatase RsbU (regulator of sigma subunit)